MHFVLFNRHLSLKNQTVHRKKAREPTAWGGHSRAWRAVLWHIPFAGSLTGSLFLFFHVTSVLIEVSFFLTWCIHRFKFSITIGFLIKTTFLLFFPLF